MKASEFCYWLQGHFEIANASGQPVELDAVQVKMIQRHLSLVFAHELDKQHGDESEQAKLQDIHDGDPPQIGGTDPNGNIYRC